MEETKSEGKCSGGGGVLHGRYELGRLLGKGSFAKVHLAKNLRTGQKVAMKIFSKEAVVRVGMRENVMREISLMKMVRHPNIVELHEVMASRSKIYLAMELVRGGELFAKVLRSGRLPEDSARRYFRQLISAVDFCHSRGVYHRDLKLENLLLDEMGNLKVADFGLSAFADHVRSDGLLHTTCGTPAYVAPEVLLKRGYDGAKVDVWSCGVILFALLAGFLPFADNNRPVMCKRIISGDFKCPRWFSGGARRLIVKMLDPNPSTRITIAQLVESSWFKKDSVPPPPPPPQPTQAPLMKKNGDEPMHMNAFHLISLSQGFDLSPLFEDKERREEGMRFATTEPAEGVVSRLECLAATTAGNLRVTKSSTAGVRLEGEERGRKGRLAVAAEIFTVAPQVLLVEVRMDGGDALEYRRFCSQELRPALKDIVWASSNSSATV